jgi:50S ribosomal protein L16 3-hydroxylase
LDVIYQDPSQAVAIKDACIPEALQKFALQSVAKALKDPQLLNCLLGEALTEPKPSVWFDPPDQAVLSAFSWPCSVFLDRRTKMLFDAKHIFINGESFRAAGKDATLLQRLANEKHLSAKEARGLTAAAVQLMQAWWEEGWWHTREAAAENSSHD